MENHTTVVEFVLLGLSDACELQMLIFLGLLLTYLLTLLGNLLIVLITLADRRLHTPMYYFLRNFAVLEIWFTSVIFHTYLIEFLGLVIASISVLGTLSVTTTCYGHILHTILHIRSTRERQKAFSTCSSHIVVVSLFYGSCIFMYIRSGRGGQEEDRNKMVALLNTVVTPMLNPFIYTLRNKQVKQVFREQVSKLLS
ncbi:olfactory receptor 49-like [Carlito syrichta]|uniref:Olfactory receptor 49-like n=1 Tax=Carlito syrichta TaxID=1868482 RepID=A0A1U7U417_CARSF|nr:olfactory receptor 49-like [Carlito syrichta]